MSSVKHESHTKEYIVVFIVLVVLTALELMIPSFDTAYVYRASALIALAVGKAFVVAYFYMHLKDEKAWLKFIAIIPLSAVAYAVMVMLETMYR